MRLAPLHRCLLDRQGASLIEAALVLPLGVLLTLGATDFSRLYVTASRLDGAAQAAAHAAVQADDDLESARALLLEDLRDIESVELELEQVCACAGDPAAWAPCTESLCGGEETNRYVRALVAAPFLTLGRYPGLPSETTLRRQVFLRTR